MGNDIGPRISVAGEKTFNDQIKKINSNLRLLGSEMNSVSKKFEGNANSIDALKEKNIILSKQMDTQKNKLSLLKTEYSKQNDVLDDLKQALEKAKKAYGENSVEANKAKIAVDKQEETVKKLGVSMNETQGFIYKLNNQIEDNTKKIKELDSAEKTAKSSLGQLTSKIAEQKEELEELKTEYENVVISSGKNSKEAKELASKMKDLSGEYNQNVTILNKVQSESKKLASTLDDIEESAKDAGDGFTVFKGALADISADAIEKIAESVKGMVTDSESAMAQFQASTGASTEAMKDFAKEIEDIYKHNYGESLDDVARAMAEVKQQTKEIDPTKLKEMTKQAIVLRDTFDFDVKETIRAAKMLMDQFGISGTEAFNLIAQGAQNGLDKNGDLLDSINEYSVHYKQLGFNAEEFFNSLENGAASGTFSIDKLGDATKEFGIRVKDTASSTDEGFQLIGLNANKMRKEFAKGGESAKKAMNKTLNALFSVDDQVKRNQAGVDLFGTMWEDLGVEGVKALTNVNGSAKKTKGTIEEINNVKYDTVESQIEELGRTLKQDLFEPTLKQSLPAIKDGLKWAIKNLPKLEPLIKTLGIAIGTAFAIKKANDFKNAIADIGSKMMDLSTSKIPGVSNAMSSLGGFLNTHPWLVLAGAIAGVGLAIFSLSQEEDQITKKLKENAEQAEANRQAWEEMIEARNKSVENAAGEFDYYARLKQELTSLVEQDGKVKQGYEGRVKYILGELNNALGTEITMTNNVIQGYKNQMKALDSLIEKQRAKAIIQAGEDAYQMAISGQSTALKELHDATKDYNDYKAKEEQLIRDLESRNWSKRKIEYERELFWKSEEAAAVKSTYEDKKEVVEGYTNTIAKQEYLQKLYAQGGAKNIAEINDFVKGSYVDKGKTIALTTKEQIEIQEDELNRLKQLSKDGNAAMYADQILAAENRLNALKKDLSNQTGVINNGSINTTTAWENLSKNGLKGFKKNSEEYRLAALEQTLRAKKGINSGTSQTNDAWTYLASQGLAKLKGKNWEYTETGERYVEGVKDGINKKKGNVWNAIARVGEGMLNSLKTVLDIHSPSREGSLIGKNFDAGIEGGVDDNKKRVLSSVKDLGKAMLKESSYFSDAMNLSAQKKSININSELLTNAYATLNSQQTIVVQSVLDGKIIGQNTVKYITNMNTVSLRSRGER